MIKACSSGRMHFLRLVEAEPTKPAPENIKIQLLRRKKQVSRMTILRWLKGCVTLLSRYGLRIRAEK